MLNIEIVSVRDATDKESQEAATSRNSDDLKN